MQSVCSNRMREKGIFLEREKKIEVWDLSGFKMEGCPYKLRVVRYHEQWEENGKKQSVSCGFNDSGSGRLPGLMGNDAPQEGTLRRMVSIN